MLIPPGWGANKYSLFLISYTSKIFFSKFIFVFRPVQFNRIQLFVIPWLQHARLPCPSPTPGACSNSCLLSQWYHPTISSSIVPFSSCPQSFAASESFPMSQLFTSGGQSIEASVFPMNIQGWIRLGLTGLISMMSRGLSRVFSNTTVRKYPFFGAQPYLLSSSHSYTWLLEKLALTIRTFVGKVMSLLFNMMSRFVIAFLPSSELHGYNHHPQ